MAGVFDEVNAAVKQAVLTQTQSLKSVVVDELAAEEMKKRKELLISGIRKYAELNRELNKARKPDSVLNRIVDGGKLEKVEYFSEAAAKKIKEAGERLQKLDAALSKAVTPDKDGNFDFEPLKKAVGNAPQADEKTDSLE